jgi:hypothetical protein
MLIFYKNGRSTANGANVQRGTILRAMVASRTKVSFGPVPETVDTSGNPNNLCINVLGALVSDSLRTLHSFNSI